MKNNFLVQKFNIEIFNMSTKSMYSERQYQNLNCQQDDQLSLTNTALEEKEVASEDVQ